MAQIRAVLPSDVASIASIYNHYVRTCIATFEEIEVSEQEMATRIEAVQSQHLPWLVITDQQTLLGYAYASPWKARSAYRFSVEVTVYLSPGASGKGVGFSLYQALFRQLEQLPVHSVLAGISLPNEASVKLHEKMGMRKIAHFSEIGYKFGRWIDTGNWQLVFPEPSH